MLEATKKTRRNIVIMRKKKMRKHPQSKRLIRMITRTRVQQEKRIARTLNLRR